MKTRRCISLFAFLPGMLILLAAFSHNRPAEQNTIPGDAPEEGAAHV